MMDPKDVKLLMEDLRSLIETLGMDEKEFSDTEIVGVLLYRVLKDIHTVLQEISITLETR